MLFSTPQTITDVPYIWLPAKQVIQEILMGKYNNHNNKINHAYNPISLIVYEYLTEILKTLKIF